MSERPDPARDVVAALLEHPDDTTALEGKVFGPEGEVGLDVTGNGQTGYIGGDT